MNVVDDSKIIFTSFETKYASKIKEGLKDIFSVLFLKETFLSEQHFLEALFFLQHDFLFVISDISQVLDCENSGAIEAIVPLQKCTFNATPILESTMKKDIRIKRYFLYFILQI